MIIEHEFTQKQPYFVVNILAYKEQIYKHSLIFLLNYLKAELPLSVHVDEVN